MFTARKKISKDKGQEPDGFEESVAQVLLVPQPGCSQHDQNDTLALAALLNKFKSGIPAQCYKSAMSDVSLSIQVILGETATTFTARL